MEKFAVVFQPDDGERVLNGHPILKHFPVKYTRKFLPRLSVQITEKILDRENNEELGCMLDVPGFLPGWDKLASEERARHLKGIVRKLKKQDISILCFPAVHVLLDPEEVCYLEDRGIAVQDGFVHRLAGMLLVLKQLLLILEKDVPFYETAVWGADTDVGRVWVEAMAGRVNHMCIGGRDRKALDRMGDVVLKTTGLSCQVTDNPEACLNNKHITVLAEPVAIRYALCRPSFHFLSWPDGSVPYGWYDNGGMGSRPGVYVIEMGWMGVPRDIALSNPLQPREELGVLDGLLTVISKAYRREIRGGRITLRQMERLHALYDRVPVRLQGFVQKGRGVPFDRFRMNYFREDYFRVDGKNNTS